MEPRRGGIFLERRLPSGRSKPQRGVMTLLRSSVHFVWPLNYRYFGSTRLIQNAILNRVEDKVEFFVSDSVTPFAEADRNSLETLVGQTNFILANPPSSDGEELKLR